MYDLVTRGIYWTDRNSLQEKKKEIEKKKEPELKVYRLVWCYLSETWFISFNKEKEKRKQRNPIKSVRTGLVLFK